MNENAKILVALGEAKQWRKGYGQKIDKICVAIYGNNKKGLIVRVDRNTRWRQALTWGVPVLIGLAMLFVKIFT